MNDIFYSWNNEKNELLKKSERNISFEVVVSAIQNNQVLEIIDNPSSNHSNQKCYVLEVNDYAYLVPFVIQLSSSISARVSIPTTSFVDFNIIGLPLLP